MIKKKQYIMPSVLFEEMDPDNLCDTFGASAHNQGWGNDGGDERVTNVKTGSFFCLDDMFEDPLVAPIDKANKDFENSINQDF